MSKLKKKSQEPAPRLIINDQPYTVDEAFRFAMSLQDPAGMAQICHLIMERYPHHLQAAHVLGMLYCQNHDFKTGKRWMGIAAAEAPNNPEIQADWATCLKANGDLRAAEKIYERVLTMRQDIPAVWNNLGNLYIERKQVDKAEQAFSKYLEFRPNDWLVQFNLARIEDSKHEIIRSEPRYRAILQQNPTSIGAAINLANLLMETGRAEEAAQWLDKIIESGANNLTAHQNRLFTDHYLMDLPAATLAQHHFQFAKIAETQQIHPWPNHTNIPDPDRKLRIGFLSGDFNTHPVGYFMQSVIGTLDRNQFELYAYYTRTIVDEITTQYRRRMNCWRDIATITDKDALDLIAQDKIDILIDLAGLTANNRIPITASKPAPIQVNYLGYFDTTGLKSMDYILVNKDLLPPEEAQNYIEKPWYLPETYICHTPAPDSLPVALPPCLQRQHITFGSFSRISKLNPRVIETWSKILLAIPSSKLLIKARYLDKPEIVEKLRKQFLNHGVAEEQLLFQDFSKKHGDYMAAHAEVDIMLDPFPYNGGTTSVDSLWMGVPIIALHGDRYCGHMAEAIIKQSGFKDNWVAADMESYVQLAVDKAGDMQALAGLRAGMREQLLQSPLCNTSAFGRHFGEALRGMWQVWCDQKKNEPATLKPSVGFPSR